MRPLVSIIIPAYNAAKTIVRALDSAVTQTYPQTEIIVVDDGSADATRNVAANHHSGRIKLIALKHNIGASGALNEGIAQAKGKYVAFLDADDEWRPSKLSKQVSALEHNPTASFSTCAAAVTNLGNQLVGDFGFPPEGMNKREAWRVLLVKNFIAKPCVVARASSLAMAGPFDVRLSVAEDQDMWIRLARLGELEFVPEVLVNIYSTPDSLMKVYAGREAEFVLPMIKRHVASLGSSLSKSEQRRIVGERYASVGRDLCHSGSYLRGVSYILQGVTTGARIGENAWFILIASPFAKAARAALASLERFVGSRIRS